MTPRTFSLMLVGTWISTAALAQESPVQWNTGPAPPPAAPPTEPVEEPVEAEEMGTVCFFRAWRYHGRSVPALITKGLAQDIALLRNKSFVCVSLPTGSHPITISMQGRLFYGRPNTYTGLRATYIETDERQTFTVPLPEPTTQYVQITPQALGDGITVEVVERAVYEAQTLKPTKDRDVLVYRDGQGIATFVNPNKPVEPEEKPEDDIWNFNF